MRVLHTTGARAMELREAPEPGPPGPGEVLLRVDAVGICGSDYGLYLGTYPGTVFPLVQGHEFCGTVLALGPGCTGRHEVGDQVAVEPLLPCGRCYPCSLGRYNCCVDLELFGVHRPGALQELLTVPERVLYGAAGMPPEVAAFAEPMSIALQGLARAGVGVDDTVLVLGAGPIGQAAILAARTRGARVAASDLVAERLAQARTSGAELVLDASSDVPAAVEEWTAGVGPTVVVEASGAARAIQRAVDLVASAGRLILIGISKGSVELPIRPFTRKEITVYGSRNSAGIFGEAVALVRDHQEEVKSVITHQIGLDQVQETIELALEHPELVQKAVAAPRISDNHENRG